MRDWPGLAERLLSEGFVCLPRLCGDEFTAAILDVSLRRIDAVMAALGDREIGIGSAAGYDEIVQRSPERWDVPIPPDAFGIDVRELPWWPLVTAILGDEAEHSFSGVVFSTPGSPAQCWHVDSPHVAAEHRRPHALNAMVALHEIPLAMGPTEFAVGSHRLTNHLQNPALEPGELVYQHARTSPATLVEGTAQDPPGTWAEPLAAGTCLLFDDRIMHRGLANRASRTRYVAYFSCREQGYAENTHFEARRSVFDPPA